MNIRRSSSVTFLALTLAVPLAASADAPPGPGIAKTSSRQATMTQAAKKPNGSGVDVQYTVDGSPQVGRNTTVTIRFDGVVDPAGAGVRLSADPGLTLSGSADLRLPAGEATTITVQVAPGAEGISYLNVFTTQNGLTSATSIPVRVGKVAPTMRSSGDLKKTPAGEPVISMPVR